MKNSVQNNIKIILLNINLKPKYKLEIIFQIQLGRRTADRHSSIVHKLITADSFHKTSQSATLLRLLSNNDIIN